MHPDLHTKWTALCRRLGVTSNTDDSYERLIQYYTEPDRYYHDLDHIRHCLEELDALRTHCEQPDLVEAAIWFHDAIYDTRAHDNEKRSADLARGQLTHLGLAHDAADTVAALILATTHQTPPETTDQTVLVDIDLSILGQPTEVFETYERGIRAEYDWVDDVSFAFGRCEILRAFLERDHVFGTPLFQERYERTARENIQHAIERWSRRTDASA
jgi:predicted metal-dependent HD superfamily phosphohydrolase